MAKISKVVKNEQRRKLVAKFAVKRAELKKIINNPKSSIEEVDLAILKLQKMPRDASKVRVRNRCSQTGRPQRVSARNSESLAYCTPRFGARRDRSQGVVKSSW